MPTYIQNILVTNINILMKQRNISTLKDLSEITELNYSTLKSWMSYKKTPHLSSLDFISNQLFVKTYMFLHPNPDFQQVIDFTPNNSRESIRINLITILRERFSTASSNKVLSVFEGTISRDTYISYIRPNMGRCMPLNTLYQISLYLSIEPYQLLV